MCRTLLSLMSLVVLLGGCAQAPMSMEPPQKPAPPPELARLTRFVGTWSDTAELVSPSPDELKEATPEGAEEMPTSFKGGFTMDWALGGMFLRNDGWYEMGDGKKVHLVEYLTWDPKAKKYHSWTFSDWGEHGEGWSYFTPDGNTLKFKVKGVGFDGKPMRGQGTWTFLDDNTAEWTFTEVSSMGKMKFKGTSKRSP